VIAGDAVTSHYRDAQQVLDDLAGLGIEYDDVVELLEVEGVQKFDDSWTQLRESLQGQLNAAAG